MDPRIFVSYRRDDAAAQAGHLAQSLRTAFGDEAVFLDTSGIEAGDRWPDSLDAALQSAKILVVVLGSSWLRLGDQYGIRRIDQSDDWVRRELEVAFSRQIRVVPVCVGETISLPEDKLPETVRALAKLQRLEIRRDYWDHDVKLLINTLRQSFIMREPLPASEYSPYPIPPPEKPDPLSDDRIIAALNGSLSRWSWRTSSVPSCVGEVRQELYREFKFSTFRDAIDFMAEVAPGCDVAMHHPHWENIFRTLYVHLTTFDIGHKVSDRDIQLAKYFDKAYGDFIIRKRRESQQRRLTG